MVEVVLGQLFYQNCALFLMNKRTIRQEYLNLKLFVNIETGLQT